MKSRIDITQKLAEGGMGEVFLARRNGQKIIVKRPLEGVAHDEAFRHEALVTSAVSHPNIVGFRGFDMLDDRPSLLLEYVEGMHLLELMRAFSRKGIRPAQAFVAHVIAEAAAGLHAAHTTAFDYVPLELVHCDVSMSNVLLGRNGEVKVIDFGAARSALYWDSSMVTGKINYIAPERFSSRTFDQRVDVYSLGVIMWELLCWRRINRVRTPNYFVPSPRSYDPGVDAGLSAIACKALAIRPEHRHESALMLWADLREWQRRQQMPFGPRKIAAAVRRMSRPARLRSFDGFGNSPHSQPTEIDGAPTRRLTELQLAA